MVFNFLVLRQAIVLIGTLAGGYTDARTGLILDRITYPMIALGILLSLVEGQWLFLGIGAAVFVLGYVVYYLGKVGGGDVKLLTGIGFLLPFYGQGFFLLNALFAACMLAVSFYSAYYVSKYARKGIDWKENRNGIRRALFFGIGITAYLLGSAWIEAMSIGAALALLLPMALASLFLAFEHGIRKRFFLKKVALKKLEEDEVVAVEFLGQKAKKSLGLGFKGVLGAGEIAKLKKAGIKGVPVFRGLPPFGPFIFLGCVIAMLQPDIVSLLFL